MPEPTPPARRPMPGDTAREAIDDLVAAHGSTVFALGLRMCGSPEEAEDLVQETFLNALRGWDDFEGRSEPSTWLYTIARRACMRMHRLRSGEPRDLEPLEQLLPGPDETVADYDACDPHEDRIRAEAQSTVEEALQTLPPEFRLPLVLVDIAELSIAQAAEVLGIPKNTVKTRVHRARLKLRRAIDATLPRKHAQRSQPAEVCFALLQAKQEALDREVEFPYSNAALCERCAAVFATLDLGADACHAIGRGPLPPGLRQRLEQALDRSPDD